MAKRIDQEESFCNVVDAKHTRPGWLLCGYGDLMKADWEVTSVSTEVAARHWMIVEMKHGARTVISTIDPEDTILRKIHKKKLDAGFGVELRDPDDVQTRNGLVR